MEAIRISCAGYPTRKPFDEFVDRFGLLAPEALDGSSDEVTACKRILKNVGLEGYQEFTDKLIEEEELSEDQKDAFKEFVKEKVREAKKANREAREARKKAIEEMSQETKAAFDTMRFYKFYPVQSPDAPDVSSVKSPFINRYYGKAHEVL